MSKKNDVVDIKTMYGSFKDLAELKSQFTLQSKALNNAYERIRQLEEENSKLLILVKDLPPTLPQPISDAKFLVPSEERLCMSEIQKLEEISQQRALNFEETKRLDILVKNLYLSREKNQTIEGQSSKLKDVTDEELLQIAEIKE